MNNPQQLIFPFQTDQRASFSSFFCTAANAGLMSRLKEIISDNKSHELIIDGAKGSGKSFLIQSICNELSLVKKELAFIPMIKAIEMGVEVIQNLASLDAVCIDDLQCVEKNSAWEEALFHLINECHQSNCSVIFLLSNNKSLDEFIELPDLLSRFKRMEHMTLKRVEDSNLNNALLFSCQNLGINLEQTERDFLLRHYSRDFPVLLEKIILLDNRAGELKRKITIPFIKETLGI